MKLKLLPALVALASSSVFALEGQIVDSNGEAVAGAKVEVVDKRTSVETDAKGYFILDYDVVDELHVSAPGYAHKTIHLHGKTIDKTKPIVLSQSVIEQVDVIGIPLHTSIIESAIPINVLAGKELRDKQAATLGDSLAGEVGIHTSFHANVASTPIIRGLSGPRVLITQNGLDASDVSRVGPDHTVSAEASTAQQIEILRGPATLFYGSGAIGGVVNVIDKRVPTDTETEGEWMLTHDTVNEGSLVSGNLNTGTGDFAFHVDGFWRDSDDYEVPVAPELEEEHDEGEEEDEHSDERTVENSAEESSGFTLGTSYILKNGYVGLSYGRFDREYGIPGHGEEGHADELEEEDHEEEEVSLVMEQDRYQLISELNLDNSFFSALNTRLGYTDYTHTEFENGEAGTTFASETSELRVELLHEPQADWHGGFVFDYKNSEFSAEGEEAFAPASTTNSFGLALLEEKHFGDVLLQLGARVEHVTVESDEVTNEAEVEFHHADEEHEDGEEHTDEDEHSGEIFVFDESYTPFSVSVGAVWDFAPGYNLGVSVSHAERAPSAAELLSFGPHLGSGFFEAGAFFELHEEEGEEGEEEINFEPAGGTPKIESSNNIDLTFRKFEGDLGIVLNVFYNQVDNFYAQFDTGLIAEFSHDHEDEGEGEVEEEAEEEAEELPVLIFRSTDATLSGFEAQGIWQVNKQLRTSLFSDYVNAELDGGGNLPRIPPMRFGTSLDYNYDRFSANLTWTHYADQDEVAELETETDGYNWVDATIDYRIPVGSSELTLFLKGENLGDEEARVHSSFLKDLAPRPGRNVRIGIRGTF